MSETNTGGLDFPDRPEPAFPSTFRSLSGESQRHMFGMTLRDYFAAKALPRVMQDGKSFSQIAEDAYDMADAMMEARGS